MKNKTRYILFIIAILTGCSNISSGLLSRNNEVLKKIEYLEKQKKYNFISEKDFKEISDIKTKLPNLSGKEKDMLRSLGEYQTKLNKIEEDANTKAKDIVTSDYKKLFESVYSDYSYTKLLSNIKIHKDNREQMKKLESFIKEYKSSIIDKNACSMFNKYSKQSGTCNNLDETIKLYNMIQQNNKNLTWILSSELKEQKEIKKDSNNNSKTSLDNTNDNSNSSNGNDNGGIKKKKKTPSYVKPPKQEKHGTYYSGVFTSYSKAESVAYSKLSECKSKNLACTIDVGGGSGKYTVLVIY